MQLRNDISEITTSIVEYHSRQMRLIENYVATGTAGRMPTAISRGYAILVDATGRSIPYSLSSANIWMYVSTTQTYRPMKPNIRF